VLALYVDVYPAVSDICALWQILSATGMHGEAGGAYGDGQFETFESAGRHVAYLFYCAFLGLLPSITGKGSNDSSTR